MQVGQIIALIALVAPSPQEEFDGQSFALMYSLFPCKLKKKTNPVNLPFPLLQYDMTHDGYLNIVVDFVDSLTLPAMIHPVSMDPQDYFNQDLHERKDIEFVSIPYRFLYRDGWDGIDTVAENFKLLEIDSSFENKGIIRKFLSSSSEDKNKILQKMKDAATRFRRETVTERDLLAVVTDQLDG